MKYELPEMQVIYCQLEDVICTSGEGITDIGVGTDTTGNPDPELKLPSNW